MSGGESPLLLGPLLRYVDDSSASLWVETRGPSTVAVRRGHVSSSARTFRVHGHHYALVELHDLELAAEPRERPAMQSSHRRPLAPMPRKAR